MEDDNRVSKFSSGLNIITRIHDLWINCENFKRNGQYSKWNDELDTIWLELARDISLKDYNDRIDKKTKEEKTGYGTQFKNFNKKMKELLPIIDYYGGFRRPDKQILENRNKQYELLMDKQLFLARLENYLKKGTTYEDSDEIF